MNATGILCYRIASDAVHPVQHVLNVPITLLYTVNDTYRFINDRLALFFLIKDRDIVFAIDIRQIKNDNIMKGFGIIGFNRTKLREMNNLF